MPCLAVIAVATAWLLQFFDTQWLLAWPAMAWCAGALLAWHCLGGRAALLVLLAGWTLCRAAWLIEDRLPGELAGRDLLVSGVVCDFPRPDAEALRLVFETGTDARSAGLPARLHLSWYAPAPELRPGERWQLLVRLKPPHGLANPGGFDFEQWLYQRGIGASGYVRASNLNRTLEAQVADCPVGSLRAALAGHIEAALAGRPGSAYVLGLTVGVTTGLSAADWELMRRTGTTHLLAISGFNIALVAAPFVLLVPWAVRAWPYLAGRPGVGPALALVVAALYSALAGFGVSVLRALLMLGVMAVLVWRRRPVDGFDALAAAALLVLAVDPPAVLAA
ncbi:MAG: ComEC family DNA internalization-related competence protein, partial [Gammaproteobacteria bacterium PRO8]|nr:ComEC family DNA internalization-related competence protein [Gammaproteobacteria bacterium PRO8]